MEGNFVERREFEEYQRRLEDQKSRWDKRLEILERKSDENNKLTTSVAELAQSVKTMATEMERHGRRLDAIEKRGGELLWKIVGYALTAGAGFVLAALLRRAGIF